MLRTDINRLLRGPYSGPLSFLFSLFNIFIRRLFTAKWFTKVDIRMVFYKIYIAKGDKYLTAFYIQFSLFKWLITPFGLTGAPITDFTIVYLNNILIYTLGLKEDYIGCIKDIL
ncbi:hypothetical protein UVI_02062690 [Ustilaginoidea virens]|uniref:Reverse transcriptase domain-containing protein n=1 Tax=Ustilaginoidea virens TaxID=1159556 RepID=A0A1B5LAQ6_USTVR|nr:hypothetical protein UVI_02062690 [Ustilaginoidea virens]